MGIFTTRALHKHESVLHTADPSITLLTESFRSRSSRFPKTYWLDLWGNYAWGRGNGVPDHVNYESSRIMDFQITFGALPNHHCILHSLAHKYPKVPYDDALTNRGPATGAVTYNRGRDFYVYRDIEPGEELFLNYGHCNHESKRNPDWAEDVAMTPDYEEAADFITEKWMDYKRGLGTRKKFTLKPPKNMNPIVKKLLPKTPLADGPVLRALKKSKVSRKQLVIALAREVGLEQRTPEWIKEHGKCLEHLKPEPSLLPDAGLGGFSQHFLKAGDIVVPAPMVHILDRNVLSLYDKDGTKTGDQLILNYCLGHPESTMLLCPNTNVILVNHCSSRSPQCRPNAKLQWAGNDPISDAWRKKTLEEISNEPHRGLGMELVALRDIQIGEEVTMDYGKEWEDAWSKHVASWAPGPRVLTAKEANEMMEIPELLMTHDLRAVWQAPHLFAGCYYWTTEADAAKEYTKRNRYWRNMTDDQLLDIYSDDGSQFVGDYEKHDDFSYWPCVPVRPDGESTYTVRILQQPFEDEQPWADHDVPRFLTRYPRDSIHFFVRQLEGDQYQKGVFRHPIGFPDDSVFPEQWKNAKQT